MERLEVSGPLVRDQRRLRGPKGQMGHKSDRAKVTREEKEMLMDVDAPQNEGGETKSTKRKVIRVESEETQDYVSGTLAISQEEARGMEPFCRVPSASHEDHFISATIAAAVVKLLGTGSYRVKEPTQLICVGSATTNRWFSKTSRG